MPLSTKGWLQLKWQQIRLVVMPTSEDTTTPLDQVSRFYQSDAYKSLDHSVTSAFFDGRAPLYVLPSTCPPLR